MTASEIAESPSVAVAAVPSLGPSRARASRSGSTARRAGLQPPVMSPAVRAEKRRAPAQAPALGRQQALQVFREALLTHDAVALAESAPRLAPNLDCLRQTIACQAAHLGDLKLATRLVETCDDAVGARFWVGRQLALTDSPATHVWLNQATPDSDLAFGLLQVAVQFGRCDLLTTILSGCTLQPHEERALVEAAAQYPRPAIMSTLRASTRREAWTPPESSAASVPPESGAARALKPPALALLDALTAPHHQVLKTLESARPETVAHCLGDLLSHAAALGRGSVLLAAIEQEVLPSAACRQVLASDATTYTLAISALCSGDASTLAMLERWGDPDALRRAVRESLGPQPKWRGCALDLLLLAPKPAESESAASEDHTQAFDLLLEAARLSEVEGHLAAATAAPEVPAQEAWPDVVRLAELEGPHTPLSPATDLPVHPPKSAAPEAEVVVREPSAPLSPAVPVDLAQLQRRLDEQDVRIARVEQENAELRQALVELRRHQA